MVETGYYYISKSRSYHRDAIRNAFVLHYIGLFPLMQPFHATFNVLAFGQQLLIAITVLNRRPVVLFGLTKLTVSIKWSLK